MPVDGLEVVFAASCALRGCQGPSWPEPLRAKEPRFAVLITGQTEQTQQAGLQVFALPFLNGISPPLRSGALFRRQARRGRHSTQSLVFQAS